AGAAGAAGRAIDARGHVVCPGFIDIHSHSDEVVLVEPTLPSTLQMGVTLSVSGNCGGSSAPVLGLAAEELERELRRLDLERGWTSFGEYAAAVEAARPAINFCSFVGHGTLRMCVMGAAAREPAAGELGAMRALLAASLGEGAIGLASGLIYPPSAYGTTGELAALCATVREHGGLYASHIRNEGARLLEAVEEGLEIGRRSGARVQLSHHKAAGRAHWGKVRDSTAAVERAREEGLDVAADQYPYTASSTGLAVTIPAWVHEGGSRALCERLREVAVRSRIRGEEVETGRDWEAIVIARARQRPEYAGRSVADLARAAGRDPLEWTCDTLIEHDGAVDIVHHSMDEEDVRYVMRRPWVCVGSDSRANAPTGPLSFGKPHPRSYGTFPRILGRYVRDEGLLTLEEAVRKMTSLAASRLRLRDRGILRAGAWADLVVFDPARIADTATYEEPHRYPEGIAYVIVNGGVALAAGEIAPERHGRFLRLGADMGA
ncbi:MAG: N-acyl-D-amino-acid deacylase family protein, partial [Candidatus Limnocylindria bacterium]